jgi:hypothetical protein
MFKQLFIFSLLIINIFSSYICKTQLNCDIFCNNISKNKLDLLKKTDWIPVSWDNGDCYFYNRETKKNIDEFPIIFLRKKKNIYNII